MLNCGLNQTVSYYKGDYSTVQKQADARRMMIAAMREVRLIANAEGVNLDDADERYWLALTDSLDPAGMPSMRQDQKKSRPMESELFCETVVALGRKHGLATPVNQVFVDVFVRP